MSADRLRQEISDFLRFSIPDIGSSYETDDVVEETGYRRMRIRYTGDEGEQIPAYLLLPEGRGPFGAALVHHQHHGQRHLGKSEVCGLVGDPWQAFGPALARRGLVVLAPDSVCFEDRRRNRSGTEADEAGDVAQHYNEMCYRLLRGDTLMRKVLSDSAQGISVLRAHPLVDPRRVGLLGHSYGGNTVLFHGALDRRIRFACSSGAACSYKRRMAQQTGIEMSGVIPDFTARYDIAHLVACYAPRPLFLASAAEDPYSQDAGEIVTQAQAMCAEIGAPPSIEHTRFAGEHALTPERFDIIVNWITAQAA